MPSPTMPRTVLPNPNLPYEEQMHRGAWTAGVLGTLNVLALVLSARLIVLIGILGGIGLTYVALQSPDPWRLGALGIYAIAIVIPTVWFAPR